MPIYLKETIHSSNGKTIVFLEGNTYPVRFQIKNLGFIWYGLKKIWWMYKDKLSPVILESLKNLNVDISSVSQNQQSQPQPNPSQNTSQSQPEKELTNKTDSDSGKMDERYEKIPKNYGFPIKKDIYSFVEQFKIDDKGIALKVQMDRWYKKGIRRIPYYIYSVFDGNDKIYSSGEVLGKEWGTYDEDEIARKLPERFQIVIDKKGKLYQSIINQLKLKERDPEFQKFLDNLDYKENISGPGKAIPQKSIYLDKYQKDFLIAVRAYGGRISLETDIQHKLAPPADYLSSTEIPPHVSNINDLNIFVDKLISEDDSIKQRYEKYIASFPFSEDEQQESLNELEEIINLVGKNYDVVHFINKLEEFGLMRPSKKVKKEEIGSGFVPKSDIKYVLNDKEIRDSIYGSPQNKTDYNRPKFFYAVVAYYLLRKVRKIESWTNAMLEVSISQFLQTAKRMGRDINYKEFDQYLNTLVNKIYFHMYGKEAPRSRLDTLNDFYHGTPKTEPTGTVQHPSINNFANFVAQIGYEGDARSDPRTAYRSLAKMYHPDSNPNQSEENTKIFHRLTELWDTIPDNIKRSSNWYINSIIKLCKKI